MLRAGVMRRRPHTSARASQAMRKTRGAARWNVPNCDRQTSVGRQFDTSSLGEQHLRGGRSLPPTPTTNTIPRRGWLYCRPKAAPQVHDADDPAGFALAAARGRSKHAIHSCSPTRSIRVPRALPGTLAVSTAPGVMWGAAAPASAGSLVGVPPAGRAAPAAAAIGTSVLPAPPQPGPAALDAAESVACFAAARSGSSLPKAL